MPVIPVLGGLRQKDHEFKAQGQLGLCSKTLSQKKKRWGKPYQSQQMHKYQCRNKRNLQKTGNMTPSKVHNLSVTE
jgi:hypothetical protein